jgi:NADH-quinone oxidoreductase subunit C
MTGDELAALVLAGLGQPGRDPGTGAGRGEDGPRWAGGTPEGVRCETGPRTVTVTVPAPQWLPALTLARDRLGGDFFDWLTAVDEGPGGLVVVVHVYSLAGRHHIFLRTSLNGPSLRLPSATALYRGAGWHERETWEMFGVIFDGHPGLVPLLLPDGFEGHPLRKDFALAARAAREWPGAPEPGEQAGEARAVRSRGRGRSAPAGVPEGWETP